MKFKFPYQALMNYRKRLEELAMTDYIVARGKHDDAVAALNELLHSVVSARNQGAQTLSQEKRPVEHLRQLDEFIQGQLVQISQQQSVVAGLAQEMDQKHQTLQERARDFKILEKLKTRLSDRFAAKIKRQELKAVDDLVTIRFNRANKYGLAPRSSATMQVKPKGK